MVIDRARTWDALLIAAEMNRRYTSYYRFMCEAISVMLFFKRSPHTARQVRRQRHVSGCFQNDQLAVQRGAAAR